MEVAALYRISECWGGGRTAGHFKGKQGTAEYLGVTTVCNLMIGKAKTRNGQIGTNLKSESKFVDR